MEFKAFSKTLLLLAAAAVLASCATSGVTPRQESDAHYKMGLSRMQSGNDEAALYEFNLALEKEHNNVDALFAAGVVYYRQDNYDKAVDNFNKVISISPDNADAYNNIGLCYVRKSEFNKALEYFNKAKNFPLSTARFDAMLNIGLTYDKMGDHEKSASSLREALLINPGSVLAMGNLANQYNILGKTDDAINLYKKALDYDSDNASIYFELGTIYFKLGKNTEATAAFMKAEELAPNSDLARTAKSYLQLMK
jgi:Tfp pilus assembly protein PilF